MGEIKKVTKVFVGVSLVVSLCVLLAFAFFFRNSTDIFMEYYTAQLGNYSSVFRKVVEIADDHAKLIDQSVADDFYHRLFALNNELEHVTLAEIDLPLLELLKEKYDLCGLAVFSRDSAGVYIYESTTREEVGLRTDTWGYWNVAFESLFNGETVTVQEGYTYKDYWIGPLSKSYYFPEYFRYAYYYNAEQDYIINGLIQDNNVYGNNARNMLEDFLTHLYEEVSYIEAASLVDLAAWTKAYYNDFSNREAPAFLYGNFERDILIQSGLKPEELSAIEHSDSFSFDYLGENKTIFIIATGEGDSSHLILILLNDLEARHYMRQISFKLMSLLVFTLVIIFAGVSYVVSKYKALLTFEEERNEEIERFTKNVAMIPEITYKCKLQDGELLLTYNHGKAIQEEHEISLKSIFRPMQEIYSASYVHEFALQVQPVFSGKSKRFEIEYNGAHYEHFVSPIIEKDGTISEIIGIANNITDRRLEEERAKHFATHDHLTDLTNRRAFEEIVADQLAIALDEFQALLLIDLDGFKLVNDTYGHISGDVVLKSVAQRIKTIVSKHSSFATVARLGGDEFAVFTSSEKLATVEAMAADLLAIIAKDFAIQAQSVALGASIGIALANFDSVNYGQLFYFADTAMYHAKRSGGNRYAFFSDDLLQTPLENKTS